VPAWVPSAPVGDVTAITVGEIEAISGVLEGITFHKAAGALGVTSFGVSISDLEPGTNTYPEHDHSEDGIGGKMFAQRPQQLGQEEVYFALRGSGTVEAEGESHPLDADHAVRVGPEVVRKVIPGPEGLRLLAIGARPGQPYETGGTL
jgi:hypothetical protein